MARGENFKNSSEYRIWGIQTSTSPHGKNFIKKVKKGDRLWFVKGKSKGKILGVALYSSHNTLETGPLLNITMTNDEYDGLVVDLIGQVMQKFITLIYTC